MGKREITEFHITERHISLVKKLKVIWNKVEGCAGAPMIDPKEPYGEGSFIENVAAGLGIGLGKEPDGRTSIQKGQPEYFNQCHKDMAITLQICLSIGKFKDGYYVKEDGEWVRKSKYPPRKRRY